MTTEEIKDRVLTLAQDSENTKNNLAIAINALQQFTHYPSTLLIDEVDEIVPMILKLTTLRRKETERFQEKFNEIGK